MFTCILLSFIITAHAAPTSVTLESISSPEGNCIFQMNDYWYVGEARYPRDLFYGDTNYDWAFGMMSTKVQIYSPG